MSGWPFGKLRMFGYRMIVADPPWRFRLRCEETGSKAVNSILRDWVKGQITAVECGVLSFDEAFMPYMLTADGDTVVERIASMDLLPPPKE